MAKEKVYTVMDKRQVDLNYCGIDEAINILTEVKEELGPKAYIQVDAYNSYDGDYSVEIVIQVDRPENEQEKAERLARLKRVEDYELQQYKLLKAKYEGK